MTGENLPTVEYGAPPANGCSGRTRICLSDNVRYQRHRSCAVADGTGFALAREGTCVIAGSTRRAATAGGPGVVFEDHPPAGNGRDCLTPPLITIWSPSPDWLAAGGGPVRIRAVDVTVDRRRADPALASTLDAVRSPRAEAKSVAKRSKHSTHGLSRAWSTPARTARFLHPRSSQPYGRASARPCIPELSRGCGDDNEQPSGAQVQVRREAGPGDCHLGIQPAPEAPVSPKTDRALRRARACGSGADRVGARQLGDAPPPHVRLWVSAPVVLRSVVPVLMRGLFRRPIATGTLSQSSAPDLPPGPVRAHGRHAPVSVKAHPPAMDALDARVE
jgi:hypothetical protein